jgi:hypothetical protein
MQRIWIVLSLVFACLALPGAAQQSQTVVEPEYTGKVMLLGADGSLTQLEQQTPKAETKASSFIIKTKVQSRRSISGVQSPVRTNGQAHFVVRAHVGDRDPATLIHLFKLDVGKGERYYVMSAASATAFGGVKSSSTDREGLPLSIEKYGTSSFKIAAADPLVPGEYCFTTVGAGQAVDCFGVDAK